MEKYTYADGSICLHITENMFTYLHITNFTPMQYNLKTVVCLGKDTTVTSVVLRKYSPLSPLTGQQVPLLFLVSIDLFSLSTAVDFY